MLDLQKTLVDGIIFGVIFSLYVMAIVLYNPRLFLGKNDVPADILNVVPPKTEQEKRMALILGLPLMLLSFGFPIWSTISLNAQAGGDASFIQLFTHMFILMLFPFLIDLILIDWLILCTLTPSFIVIPGSEGMAGYKDYGFHLKAHSRAIVPLTALSIIISGVISLF